jgi:phosphatidylglycerol:prolipoprotein diacylglycerol transferase
MLYLRIIIKSNHFHINKEEFFDISILIFLFSIMGGRIGHIIFYELDYYKNHLIEAFYIFEGGMSFFGAFIFGFFSLYIYSLKTQKSFFIYSDLVLAYIPLWIFFIRIGSFINNEIWGRDFYNILYHIRVYDEQKDIFVDKVPIVLYEAFFEGFVLFIILQYLSYQKVKIGIISALFLFLYGLFRFILEFFKLPSNKTYILGYFTFSQFLAFCMFFISLYMFYLLKKRNKTSI